MRDLVSRPAADEVNDICENQFTNTKGKSSIAYTWTCTNFLTMRNNLGHGENGESGKWSWDKHQHYAKPLNQAVQMGS